MTKSTEKNLMDVTEMFLGSAYVRVPTFDCLEKSLGNPLMCTVVNCALVRTARQVWQGAHARLHHPEQRLAVLCLAAWPTSKLSYIPYSMLFRIH